LEAKSVISAFQGRRLLKSV